MTYLSLRDSKRLFVIIRIPILVVILAPSMLQPIQHTATSSNQGILDSNMLGSEATVG